MRRWICILTLFTALLSGCEREPVYRSSSADSPVLGITLEMPSAALVKATVPASPEENAIHDLKIWVFHSGTHALVASLELDGDSAPGDFPQPGSVKHYSLPVSWDFALERPRPAVDVYVLANSASVTLDQPLYASQTSEHEVSSWTQVKDVYFGGADFAPSTKVTEVSANGLPMSGAATGLAISGKEPTLSVPTVPLERCVSKIRFLFSQMYTEADDPAEAETFRVDRIVLDGDVVPEREYVFAVPSAPRVSDSRVAAPVEYAGADPVAVSETPERYAYANQDGPSYERVVTDALDAGKLTDCGTYYLRESDRALSGTIYYTVVKGAGTAQEESRSETHTFSIPAPEVFPRNHTWTVYGYYISKRSLQLSVSVLPWEKSDYTIDYSLSSLMVTWKLSVLDGSYAGKVDVRDDSGKVLYTEVTLKNNQPCIAYLYVATPEGGQLQVIPEGEDAWAFAVSFDSDVQEEVDFTDIRPSVNNGRINIYIDRKEGVTGVTGKRINLTFKAFTANRESEIDGASECIDQLYYFILP